MPSPVTKTSKILIIGGGTWGCSTALHLARRGYTNITVLDAHPIPSPISAGNDVNKIVEQGAFSDGDDEASVAQALLHAAAEGWSNDPVFKPYYHDTGYIVAGSSPEAIGHLEKREICHFEPGTFQPLNSAADFQATMPKGVLTGDFPGWKGFYMSKGSGWVHARKALVSAYTEAKRLGVTFVTGAPTGQVESLVYSDDQDVVGVKTADGKEHRADRTILAAGASSPQFLDFENQLRATAWTLGHIAMTAEETALFKDLPVLFNIEKGFFMEPDEDRHELKMCDETSGILQLDAEARREATRFGAIGKTRNPQGIRATTERVSAGHDAAAGRETAMFCEAVLVRRHAKSGISHHLPSKTPLTGCGTGDSGHGFMHIPSIGGYIADCLEGTLEKRFAQSCDGDQRQPRNSGVTTD